MLCLQPAGHCRAVDAAAMVLAQPDTNHLKGGTLSAQGKDLGCMPCQFTFSGTPADGFSGIHLIQNGLSIEFFHAVDSVYVTETA